MIGTSVNDIKKFMWQNSLQSEDFREVNNNMYV